jgi:hypothetical protein
MQDLVQDWTETSKSDIKYFIPMDYRFKIAASEFTLRLPCNEGNIIEEITSTEQNAFMIFHTNLLTADISLPFLTYEDTAYVIPFQIVTGMLKAGLSFPANNILQTTSSDKEYGEIKSVSITGSYSYCTAVNREGTDNLLLSIRGDKAQVTVHGYLIRYFLVLRECYAGTHIFHKQLPAFLTESRDPERVKRLKALREVHKPPQNMFVIEIDAQVANFEALLPINLSTSNYIALNSRELQLDMRNVDHYLGNCFRLTDKICI